MSFRSYSARGLFWQEEEGIQKKTDKEKRVANENERITLQPRGQAEGADQHGSPQADRKQFPSGLAPGSPDNLVDRNCIREEYDDVVADPRDG